MRLWSCLTLPAVPVVLAGVAILLLRPGGAPREPAAAVPAVPVLRATAPALAAPRPPAASSVAVAAPAADHAPVACPHQAIDLAGASGGGRACVAAARIVQTGSRRRFVFEPEGLMRWRLEVDLTGGRPQAVRLVAEPGGARRECRRRDCAGLATAVQIGRPDAHGERVLALHGLVLPGAAGETPLTLKARLLLPPDPWSPALACNGAAGPPLRIVERGGAGVQEFCPLGGAGFELDGDGRRRYVFVDLEGGQLVVGLAPDGQVERVQWRGHACRGLECAGVTQAVDGDAADPGSARRFHFAAQALRSAQPGETPVLLDGSVTMAAQAE